MIWRHYQMGAIRLGDLVAVDADGTMGVIIGRTALGWIVKLGDDSRIVTPKAYKVVAA